MGEKMNLDPWTPYTVIKDLNENFRYHLASFKYINRWIFFQTWIKRRISYDTKSTAREKISEIGCIEIKTFYSSNDIFKESEKTHYKLGRTYFQQIITSRRFNVRNIQGTPTNEYKKDN